MTTPQPPPVDAPPSERLPGCGLAAYVGLLLTIGSAGVIGLSFSWYSVVAGGDQLSPTRSSYGGVVDPAVLRPLRESGLLGETEIPDVFHAERLDGAAACAIVGDRLVRISAEHGAQQLRFDEILELTGSEAEVVATGTTATIACVFGPGEGGGSFKAMLDRR